MSTPSDRNNSATSKSAGGGLRLRALLAVGAAHLCACKTAISAGASVAVVCSLTLSSPSISNNSSALKLTGLLCWARQVRACNQSADEVSALSAAARVASVVTLVVSTPSDRDNSATSKSAGGGLRLRALLAVRATHLCARKTAISAGASVAVVRAFVLSRPSVSNNSSALKLTGLLCWARQVRARNQSAAKETTLHAATCVAGVVTLVVSTPSDRDNSATSKSAGGGLRLRALLAVGATHLCACKTAISAGASVAVVCSLTLSSPSVSNNSSALKLTGLLCWARQVRARNQSADEVSALSAAARVASVVTLVVSTPSDRDNSATSKSAGGGLRLRALLAVRATHPCARKTAISAGASVAVVCSLTLSSPSISNNSSALKHTGLLCWARQVRARNQSAAKETTLHAATCVAGVVTLVVSTPSDRDNSATSKSAGGGLRLRALLAVRATHLCARKTAISAGASVAVVCSLTLSSPSISNNSSTLKLTGLLCWARQVRARNQSADEVSALSAAARVASVVTLVVSTPSDRDNSATSKSAGGGLRLRALLAVGATHLCARKTSVDAVAHVAVVGSLVVAHPSVCNNSSALQSACLLLGLDTQRCVVRTIALTQKVVLTALGTAWTCTATGLTLCTLRHTDRVEREAVAVPFKRTAPLAWCAVVVGPALLS